MMEVGVAYGVAYGVHEHEEGCGEEFVGDVHVLELELELEPELGPELGPELVHERDGHVVLELGPELEQPGHEDKHDVEGHDEDGVEHVAHVACVDLVCPPHP